MKRQLRYGLVIALLSSSFGLNPGVFPPVQSTVQAATLLYQDGEFLADKVPADFEDNGQNSRAVRDARSNVDNRVTSALNSGNQLSAADQDIVRNWIGQVVMAEMTSTNPEVQSRLGTMRQDFFRKYVKFTSNESTRNFLINNVIILKAADVAKKNYHPAARVNAALILGLLDTQEGESGQRPPRPSMQALGELLNIVDDAQSPEYLVAACMSGIQRHAEIDGQFPVSARMPPVARTRVVDSMLAILTKYQQNRDEQQVGYVLSRRAMQTLAGLRLGGNDPKTAEVKAMANAIVTDESAGKWLRLDGLQALAGLPLDSSVAYLERLGQLVVLVSKSERSQVLEAQKLVQLDNLIKEKTGQAQAKAKAGSQDGLPVDGPAAAGAASQRLDERDDRMNFGAMGSGGGGGFMDLSGFDDSGLFPYHLHYARTNVKVAVIAALQILGTNQRTPGGLKVALANDADAQKLIDQLDRELKALLAITDIGLVAEKPLTDIQRRTMDPQELYLLEQSDSVRVLAGFGKSVDSLEKIVGKVELPGAETTTAVGTDAPATSTLEAPPRDNGDLQNGATTDAEASEDSEATGEESQETEGTESSGEGEEETEGGGR